MDYQKILNEYLIEFVKEVLTKIQLEGLHGEQHLYLSFVTDDPQVQLSERMKNNYPKEITIVLQNQFDNLIVKPDSFSVKLSFNNIPEVIIVPFRCLTSFVDPSVNFKLPFKPQVIPSDQSNLKAFKSEKKLVDNTKAEEETKVEKFSNNVILLDRFRNKNQPQ